MRIALDTSYASARVVTALERDCRHRVVRRASEAEPDDAWVASAQRKGVDLIVSNDDGVVKRAACLVLRPPLSLGGDALATWIAGAVDQLAVISPDRQQRWLERNTHWSKTEARIASNGWPNGPPLASKALRRRTAAFLLAAQPRPSRIVSVGQALAAVGLGSVSDEECS